MTSETLAAKDNNLGVEGGKGQGTVERRIRNLTPIRKISHMERKQKKLKALLLNRMPKCRIVVPHASPLSHVPPKLPHAYAAVC